ncbi:MAG: sensor histidine kinase [Planctomycetota bacterium]
MTSPRSQARMWFAVVAGVMLLVLGWLTVALLRLERDERIARRETIVQERMRLALWRMDSWLSPQLARESLRPPQDYRAFPVAPTAWTRGFSKIAAGEVMVQSPLLGAESPLFPLHFEVEAASVRSPQVPMGNERDFAEANGMSADVLDRSRQQLLRVQKELPLDQLEQKVLGAVAQLPSLGCNTIALEPVDLNTVAAARSEQTVQVKQSVQELDNRQRNFLNNVQIDSGAYPSAAINPGSWLATVGEEVGPLVPVWVDGKTPELVFARRVRRSGGGRSRSGDRLQVVLVDWPRLQQEMLALLEDLFEDGAAELVRCESPTPEEQPSMLASVPARLVATYHGPVVSADLPISTILWTTWGVTLLGLVVLGFTLRTAIGFGERRARFASAVTHELRTPLTTFRMYSEMLADGIVTEPKAQQEYLRTLQRESDRLARVVENVLAWSRLEDGRFTARRERVAIGGLLSRFEPVLEQRLGEAELELSVRASSEVRDAVLDTDEEAVGQILFNLVDNAAKYASEAVDRRVTLSAERSGSRVQLMVCDRGPGVSQALHERVFVPFDRGSVRTSSNDVPGVGLGLPLARGLARDLGGELSLQVQPDGGACFVLELPLG